MSLPARRKDCAHECDTCDLADPQTCRDFALMTAETHPSLHTDPVECPDCHVPTWAADLLVTDDAGTEMHYRYRECPRCHRMWVPAS
jgi:hypothetical protein